MRVRGQDSCRWRRGQSRWRHRGHAHTYVALAFSVVLMSLAGGLFPTWAAGTGVKAMWGPYLRNGNSLFPVYRELGITIYQDDLRWNEIAPHRPRHPRSPSDPAYRWPPDVTNA